MMPVAIVPDPTTPTLLTGRVATEPSPSAAGVSPSATTADELGAS